jgi:hypothetical protein
VNDYEQKLEARRRRLLERADRAQAEASAAAGAAGAIADRIPMGQPILVGHHSERRHRRDLERIDRNMRKASEASAHAEQLRRRAAKVGTTISSEDPDAVEKLEEKVEELEASRELMKQVNAAHRKGGWDAVRAKGLLTEEQIVEIERTNRERMIDVAELASAIDAWELHQDPLEDAPYETFRAAHRTEAHYLWLLSRRFAPPKDLDRQALRNLVATGLVELDGSITELGRRLLNASSARLKLDPLGTNPSASRVRW